MRALLAIFRPILWVMGLPTVIYYVVCPLLFIWGIIMMLPDGEKHTVPFSPSMVTFSGGLDAQGNYVNFRIHNNSPYYIDTVQVDCDGYQWDTEDMGKVHLEVPAETGAAPGGDIDGSTYVGVPFRRPFSRVTCRVVGGSAVVMQKGWKYRNGHMPERAS